MSRKLVRQQPLRPLRVKITLLESVEVDGRETGITYETTLETGSLPDLITRTRKMIETLNTPVEVKVINPSEQPQKEAENVG